jgi:peptidyl-tRNA hydrolase, PTH1 family
MWMVVGLGNPGARYQSTRHNIGFRVIDALSERLGFRMDEKRFRAEIGRSEGSLYMKPQTFMNLSGQSVGPALGYFKLATSDLVVVHDELDFELGRIQVKQGGGHGGHNGLRSLLESLPDANFTRIRLGVGRPSGPQAPADYLLSSFPQSELPEVERMIGVGADAMESIIKHGISRSMAVYNRLSERDAPSGGHKVRESRKDNE